MRIITSIGEALMLPSAIAVGKKACRNKNFIDKLSIQGLDYWEEIMKILP